MNRTGSIISTYLLRNILPYFAAAWLILTVIMFVQQAGRYSEIFFGIDIPASLAWQLTVALIPNVVAFTCPMAILVGTIIGLTKLQGDSELVAIRASGVGHFQIALPIMLLGLLLSGFAFLVNLEGVPFAAGLVRNVALQTALKKLESPVEPGIFNRDVTGYTIYVREGDPESGRWHNIFIYNEDVSNNSVRLITSKEGRIDTSDSASELVLENALVTTLPLEPGHGKYASENLGNVRLAIRTSRSEILEKITNTQLSMEELGIEQLSEYASTLQGREKVEVQLLKNRRILLSITPFIFCLLGTIIVLRLNRGGRNFGMALALTVLILYYVFAFLGEQMARTGSIGVLTAAMMPLVGSTLLMLLFGLSCRLDRWFTGILTRTGAAVSQFRPIGQKLTFGNRFMDVTTGIRDFDLIRDFLKKFVLTVFFLALIFLIFTAFELWKFAGAFNGGVRLLFKYLFYLLPVVYTQIAAPATMIAVLATYAIKSRQNEIITWTAAGQSIYRLLIPCFLLTLLIGGVNWSVQEYVLPPANRTQEDIRSVIRNRGVPPKPPGQLWTSSANRVYAFMPDPNLDPQQKTVAGTDVAMFEFSNDMSVLTASFRSPRAFWSGNEFIMKDKVERSDVTGGRVQTTFIPEYRVAEAENPFIGTQLKPQQLSTRSLIDRVQSSESDSEKRNLEVTIERRYAVLFVPLVMALFTAPFAISFSKQGKAAGVGGAVTVWLLYAGAASICEQLGINGSLPPWVAVWAPLFVFASLGAYLIARTRT
jgi:lipopolysaccharide export LptBFGC system permease protein LptF